MKRLLFVFLFPLFIFASQEECDLAIASNVTLKHREQKGIGYRKGYSTLGVFLTPTWDRVIQPFFDGRLHVFNNGRLDVNLGAGFRYGSANGKWAAGPNLYYDFRESRNLRTHQIAGGLEILSKYFDMRFNGYLPIGGLWDERSVKTSDIAARRAKISLPNANFEFGVPLGNFLYVGVGPYYLFRQSSPHFKTGKAWGGKARMTARLWKWLSLGIEGSYDRLFHGIFQGYVAIDLLPGPNTIRKNSKTWNQRFKTKLCRKQANRAAMLTQSVERFEIIPMIRKRREFRLD